MGGGEGGNFVSGGEAPSGIFNSAPPDSLCRPGNVSPTVLAVFQSLTPSVGPLFEPL